MQVPERRPALCDDQAAAGLAVEPVHQVEAVRFGSGRAQRFDDTVTHAATTVHGDAGRLVHHDDVVVLVKDRRGHLILQRARSRARGGLDVGLAQRGDPQPVTGLHPLVRLGTPAVDPQLPLAQQAVDMSARHTLQLPQQVVVQALSRVLLTDHQVVHALPLGWCRYAVCW
jgi:hypothetical protein